MQIQSINSCKVSPPVKGVYLRVNAILHGSLDQSREQIMTNTLNKLYLASTNRLLFFGLIILEHSKTICSHTVLHVTAKLCRSTTTSFSPVLEAHQSFSLMSCCAKPSHNMLHSSRGLHLLVTKTKGDCSKSISMQSNSHFLWRQKKATKTMDCSKSISMQSNSHFLWRQKKATPWHRHFFSCWIVM